MSAILNKIVLGFPLRNIEGKLVALQNVHNKKFRQPLKNIAWPVILGEFGTWRKMKESDVRKTKIRNPHISSLW